MTKRKNYPRLRNGKLEGTGMPPHFIDEKKKEVVFHIPGGFPVVMAIPITPLNPKSTAVQGI